MTTMSQYLHLIMLSRYTKTLVKNCGPNDSKHLRLSLRFWRDKTRMRSRPDW